MSLFPRAFLVKAIPVLLATAGFSAWGSAQAANTYYVRVDGGTAAQCTGLADAPYPGTGRAQACAWNSPHAALPASGTPRILGGDTLVIGPGTYNIGFGAPGAAGGRCYADGSWDCYLAPVPSGPSATAKTRIVGKGFDAGCTVKPKFTGVERVGKILNLEGSSNVEVACLEVTDQSDCVEQHTDATAACKRDTAPFGNWASVGLSASASKNVWLHDLDIHGLANRGVMAGGLTDWTVEHVKIVANGGAGWDGDIGTGSSDAGQMVLRDVEVAWNGCGERWQTRTPWACWAQQGGGYGDGLGTAKTGGQWLVEDSYFHHNTSDGLDLLYLDGAAGTSVTVRRTYAVGNAGNQLKTNGNATLENNVVVGSCAYFNGRDKMLAGDQCRAQGNAMSVGLMAGNTATIRYNTVTGQGDCLILTSGGDATSKVNIVDNALYGRLDYLANAGGNVGELACGHYHDSGTPAISFSGNLFYNTKAGQCPAGSICNQDPLFANADMANFDGTPMAGSPLIDKVPVVAGVASDFLLQPRPAGAATDIGAIEVQSGGSGGGGTTPPPPTCVRGTPTVSLVGPTAAVAAGTAVSYTVNVTNNDSAACAGATFSLAKSVPAGWSGTLAGASLALNPGASASTTLSVVSAASAAAGGYGIGVGTSSAVGSVHTANASATYTVAAQTQQTPPTAALSETVGTDQPSYVRGQKVYMSALVKAGGVAFAGATVKFTVTRPGGGLTVVSATSGSDGYARATYAVSKAKNAVGSYAVKADASASNASPTTASTSFSVR